MVELSRHGYFDLSSKKDKIETPNLSKKVMFHVRKKLYNISGWL